MFGVPWKNELRFDNNARRCGFPVFLRMAGKKSAFHCVKRYVIEIKWVPCPGRSLRWQGGSSVMFVTIRTSLTGLCVRCNIKMNPGIVGTAAWCVHYSNRDILASSGVPSGIRVVDCVPKTCSDRGFRRGGETNRHGSFAFPRVLT